MARIITNTFTLTVVPDVEATRPNLVHCSAFNKDRMGWWIQPSSSNAYSFKVVEGQYGIDGYNAYELQALPGTSADLRQYIAKEYKGTHDEYNANKDNYGLDPAKWYTLSFRVKGLAQKANADGTYTANGETRLYVYLVGNNGGGVSVIDTAAKYIIDGVEKTPTGDMSTAVTLNWTATVHTITFKTRSDLKTIANAAIPVLYFRSFGEGNTAYPSYFANGSCYFRISCIKIEEGITATAYTPHATELLPPVHAVAFKRDNTDISGTAPTGGTYTSPTPADWSDGIPSGEQRLWETKAVFVPELPSATWSKPSPVGDTSDSDVEFSPYSGTPTSHVSENLAAAGTAATSTTNLWFDPARNSDADFSKMIWRAERQKKNGVWDEKWAIVKVKGETGEKGNDAVLLDLDNEMDSIAVDSSGTVTTEQSVTTNVTIFKGATAQFITGDAVAADSLNGVTASKTSINGKVSVTFTFPAGTTFADQHYTAVIGVTFGGATYTATFTLAPVRLGKDACLYKVLPSMSSCPFTRNEDNTLSPTQYTLKCGYVAVKGDTSTTVADCTTLFGGEYRIYSRSKSKTWGNTWFQYDGGLPITPNVIEAVEFCIAKKDVESFRENDTNKALIVDREVVPVVVGGANGADGENAFIVDLDNEMDAIPCDSTGRLSSQRTYNLNLGAFYGTQETALTSVVATIKDCNGNTSTSGISVSTNNLKTPVVTVSAGTYNASPYTISLECTSDYGTRTVVFTLVTQKAGAPGVTPTIYQLAPSHTSLSYTRNDDGSLTGSNTLTCKMKQTTGSSTSETDVSSSSTYYIYYGFNDAASPSTRLPSGGLTVSSSVAESNKNVVLELWKGERTLTTSVRLDRETIPILKDGSKGLPGDPGNPGDKGDDGTIAWLSCPYVAIPCYNTGKPKIASFTVEAKKRIGDGTPTSTSSPYKIEAKISYKDDTSSTTDDNYKGSLSVGLNQSNVLTSVVINLKYNTTVIQTITLKPILDGAMGSAGEKYLPIVLGIYDSTTTYQWTNGVRHGCYYAIEGIYYIFYVRNNGTNSTLPAPTGEDDPNWEQAYRLYTIFTDCFYGTNANVGGFLLSDSVLMSAEVSYIMTYRGSITVYYYCGLWNSTTSYAKNYVVYYSGYYYLCTTANTGSTPSSSSYWRQLSSSSELDKYIINMCSGYSTSAKVGPIQMTGYYDVSTKDRPFIASGGTFWTPKGFGKITDTPSTTSDNKQWRELFDEEKIVLGITSSSTSSSFSYSEGNIYRRSIPKYFLNGKVGTSIMLQPDDTIWTYDSAGKQTLGIPYGKHIEIDPSDGKLMFFGSDGVQNGEVSGEAVADIASLLGSSSAGFSGKSGSLSKSGNGSSGQVMVGEILIGSVLSLTSNGTLNISSSISVTGSSWSTSSAWGGDTTNSNVTQGDIPFDGAMVAGSTSKKYANTATVVLRVQKQLPNGVWVPVATASDECASSWSSTSAYVKSSRLVSLSPGDYRIVLEYKMYLYANRGKSVTVSASSVSAAFSSYINLHRFFGNGFAFGSTSNNFFAAANESGNMHIKALTNSGNHGFELDKDNGLTVIRDSKQGKVPVLLYYGIHAKTSDTLTNDAKYKFDDSFNVEVKWEKIGLAKVTLPNGYNIGNTIVTLTPYLGAIGVSARIAQWTSNFFYVEINNDYSSGDWDKIDHDYGGFLLKLEYIG